MTLWVHLNGPNPIEMRAPRLRPDLTTDLEDAAAVGEGAIAKLVVLELGVQAAVEAAFDEGTDRHQADAGAGMDFAVQERNVGTRCRRLENQPFEQIPRSELAVVIGVFQPLAVIGDLEIDVGGESTAQLDPDRTEYREEEIADLDVEAQGRNVVFDEGHRGGARRRHEEADDQLGMIEDREGEAGGVAQAVLEGGRRVVDEALDAFHQLVELTHGGEQPIGLGCGIGVAVKVLRDPAHDIEAAEADAAVEVVVGPAGQLLDDGDRLSEERELFDRRLVAVEVVVGGREVEEIDLMVAAGQWHFVEVDEVEDLRKRLGCRLGHGADHVTERKILGEAEDRIHHVGELIEEGADVDADVLRT